ncbi:hypothetical protein R3P38DRAFT_2815654 [Favolaschia claudopus]|uniref:Uncharacterized protein n=1 Tax=Favolaschia claudopus TaxID=2862362 RepID=A0AAV9Z0R6_9AGAR
MALTLFEGLSSGAKLLDALSGVLSALENIVKVGDELAKINPYVNAAWKVLTSVYKIVQNQREADEKVVNLVEAMAKLYSFAKEVDFVVKNSEAVEETVLRITMQTMECALCSSANTWSMDLWGESLKLPSWVRDKGLTNWLPSYSD